VSELAIGEVARRTGIPATTLRYYEEYGLIAPPPRRAGRRQYPEEILDTLTVVEAARAAGFGLREVQVLLDAVGRGAPRPAWRTLAALKRPQLNEQIQRLKAMLGVLDAISACECSGLQECAQRLRAHSRRDRARASAPAAHR
jgi:DNA-binding transcriptional MerR regulator